MLKIVFDLSQFESVEIVPIADTHIGNILCDIQALHDTISYVMKEPDDPKCARICLLNGDLTESVTRQSVGNIFDMTMTPQVQVATMIEMLKLLSVSSEKYPQGKILSYCGGNYSQRAGITIKVSSRTKKTRPAACSMRSNALPVLRYDTTYCVQSMTAPIMAAK